MPSPPCLARRLRPVRLHPRPVRATRRPFRGMEPRCLSDGGARPLRSPPYRAQRAGRRQRRHPPGPPAAGLGGAQADRRCPSRSGQLIRGRNDRVPPHRRHCAQPRQRADCGSGRLFHQPDDGAGFACHRRLSRGPAGGGVRAVATGGAPTAPGMPAFGRRLEDQQRTDVMTFIRNSRGNQAPAATLGDAARLRGMLAAAPR